MQINVTIHEAWLARPEDLRRVMALLAGLEVPPPGAGPRQAAPAATPDPEDDEESFDPEGRAPGRRGRYPGDDDRAQASDDGPDQDAPTDGRQLLGWASKQVPDLKGMLIGYGKKKGLHSKIVEWTPQQVTAAYRFARARQRSPADRHPDGRPARAYAAGRCLASPHAGAVQRLDHPATGRLQQDLVRRGDGAAPARARPRDRALR